METLAECVHETDMGWPAGWCSCHHPAPVKKSKPKKDELEALMERYFDRPAPIDKGISIAEGVASFELCDACLTPIAPIGCNCSRRRFHSDDWEITADLGESGFRRIAGPGRFDHALNFLDSDEAITAFGAKACAGMAFAVASRSARRAGLTDEERQADRLEVIERFCVDPKWRKLHRQEANHLPV